MSNNDDNSNHSIIHHKKTIHQNTITILKSSVAPPTTIAPPPTSSSSSSQQQQQQLQLENSTLREKNDKLKSLLGRSAKAQRDAKHELERIKRLYESIKLENETLGMRVEALANRPTHMDLLADFEANFDRALLSVGNSSGGNTSSRGQQQQSGGEDAAEARYYSSSTTTTTTTTNEGTTTTTPYLEDHPSSSTGGTTTTHLLLLAAEQQLDEANSQIANLESIHATHQQRYDALEKSYLMLQKERKSLTDTCAILRLELRGSKSDMEKWEREYRMACATVEEMRLEVDLATRAAAEANRRAAYAELGMSVGSGGGGVGGMTGMPARGSGGVGGGGGNQPPADNDYVSGLEAKVAALQEWALASAESKRLTAERCMELEERVRELEEQQGKSLSSLDDGEDGRDSTILMSSGLAESVDNKGCSISNVLGSNADASAGGNTSASSQYDGSPSGRERKLWTKSSSLVVGAGMVGHAILELGPISVEPSETVILRWKFDITPADLDIDFSVLKGMCEDARARRGADACLRVRRVMGGGGGDVGGAFARQNACTMVWSNEMSWVRPRTVKWTAEAVAIGWGD